MEAAKARRPPLRAAFVFGDAVEEGRFGSNDFSSAGL
jgi:hypothetical protein